LKFSLFFPPPFGRCR